MSSPTTFREALSEIDRLKKQVAILRECLGEPAESPTGVKADRLVDHEESARVLRELVEGTDPSKGEEFFPSVVRHLAAALKMKYAFVWEFPEERDDRFRTLAFWADDRIGDRLEGPLTGTPCARTIEQKGYCEFPSDVQRQFPNNGILSALAVESFFAAPLFNSRGEVIGNLGVMDDVPRRLAPEQQAVLELFAARAGAELARQKAEREIQDREAYFRALIEQALDIVTVLSADGTVRYQSPSLERILGWRPEERIGRNAFELLHPDDLVHGQTTLRAVLDRPGAVRTGEFRLRHRDGSWRTLEAVGRATADAGGDMCIIVNMRDVTERKRTEQALSHALADLKNIMETVPDVLFTLDTRGNLVQWNSRAVAVTGYSDEELANKPALAFVPFDEQERTAVTIQRAFMEGSAELDGHILTKEGRRIPYHWSGAVLKDLHGHTIGITGVGRDVSERKRAEEEIRRQRRHLVAAQALAHLGSWEWDIESGAAIWSEELYRIFGHEPFSIRTTYDTFLAALHPEDHDRTLAAINDALAGRKPYDVECRIVRPNGDVRTIHCRGAVTRNAAGHSIGMEGTVLDMTERKQIEEALRSSEERWQLAVRGSNDGIWDWDVQTGDVFFSCRWKAMRGFEEQELTNSLDEWRSRIHPDDLDRVLQRVDAYLAKQAPEFCEEYRVLHKDGSYRWVLDRGMAVWDENGTPLRMAGSESDITERKQAENALRDSEERYRMLVDLSPSGIFVYEGGRTVYVNRAACRILGADQPEQILARPTLDFIHPDCHAAVLESARALLTGGEPVRRTERRYLKLDGTVIDVEVDAAPIVWNGKPAIQGIFADITERKRTVEALRASNEKLQQALFASNTGLWDWNTETGEVRFSKEWKSQLGYGEAELPDLFETWESRLHPDDRERAVGYARAYRANPVGAFRLDFRLLHKDGSYRWFDSHAAFVMEPDGRRVRLLGSHSDITERKRAEEALRDSEERLRLAMETAGMGAWDWDVTTDRAAYSHSLGPLFGLPPGSQHVTVEEFLNAIAPEDRERVGHAVTRSLEDDAPYCEEYRAVWPDGTMHWLSDRGHVYRNEQGLPVRMIGVVMDITERRQAEEALRDSQQRLQALVEGTTDAIFTKDVNGRYLLFNGAAGGFVGKNPEEVLGHDDTFIFSFDEAKAVMEADRKVMTGGLTVTCEDHVTTADGVRRTFLTTKGPLYDATGAVSGLFGIARDITERQAIEKKLKEMNLALTQAMPGISRIDEQGRYTEVNQSYAAMLGCKQEELVGQSWEPTVHPDDLPLAFAAYEQMVKTGKGEFECRAMRKDGSIFFKQVLLVKGGQLSSDGAGHHCFMRDITERRRAEEALRASEERFAKAFRASPHPIGITEVETGRCIDVNEACLELFGYSRDEVIGRSTLLLGIWPNPDTRATLVERLKSGQPVRNSEMTFRSKTGEQHHILVSSDLVEVNGVRCLLTVGNDITERKRAEEALRMTQYAVDHAADQIFVIGSDGYFQDVNESACRRLGYTKQELLTMSVMDIDPDFPVTTWEAFWTEFKNSKLIRLETRHRSKTGEIYPVEVVANYHLHNGRELDYAIVRDITERKQAEEALRASEEFNRVVLDSLSAHIAVLDREGTIVAVNRAWQHFAIDNASAGSCGLGVGANYLTVCRLASGESAEARQTLDGIGDVLAGQRELFETEYPCHSPAGPRWFAMRVTPLTGDAGGAVIAHQDVTGRKQAEEALRESEQSIRALQEAVSLPEQTFDERIEQLLRLGCRRFDLPIGLVTRIRGEQLEIAHVWDPASGIKKGALLPLQVSFCGATLRAEQPLRFEHAAVSEWRNHPAYRLLGYECYFGMKLMGHRELYGTICFLGAEPHQEKFSDADADFLQLMARWLSGEIERQSALEGVRRSERQLRTVLDALPVGVWFTDQQGQVLYGNPAGHRIWSDAARVGLPGADSDTLWWESIDRTKTPHRWAIGTVMSRGEATLNETIVIENTSGERRTVKNSSVPVKGESGEMLGALVLNEDITDRIQAEQALRQNHALLSAIMDASVDLIYVKDFEGRYVHMNQAGAKVLGMTASEIVGWDDVALWGGELAASCRAADRRVMASGETVTVEETDSTHGKTVHYLTTKAPYRDPEGRIIGVIGVSRDITEQKRAEDELRRSHTFIRQVIDIDPNFIFAKDREGRFKLVNKAVADAYGTTVDELIGKTDADFNPNREEVEFFRLKDLEVMDTLQERFIPEEVITDAAGKTRWLQTVKRPILDDQGRATMVLGAATDITERKRIEEELRRRERDLRAAIDERERISQDLHDGILQSLYAVGLGLESCKPLLKRLRARKVTQILNQAAGHLERVMQEVRGFIAGLESNVWRERDLSTALRTMIQTLTHPYGTSYRLSLHPGVSRTLTPEQGLHLFSIVREAISNSLRHGRAKRTAISLRPVKGGVRLTIQDDGRGFVPGSNKSRGRGLANMAARATRVGGTLSIFSKPHRGTRVTLDLPQEAAHVSI